MGEAEGCGKCGGRLEERVVGSLGLSGLRANSVTREASGMRALAFLSVVRPACFSALGEPGVLLFCLL